MHALVTCATWHWWPAVIMGTSMLFMFAIWIAFGAQVSLRLSIVGVAIYSQYHSIGASVLLRHMLHVWGRRTVPARSLLILSIVSSWWIRPRISAWWIPPIHLMGRAARSEIILFLMLVSSFGGSVLPWRGLLNLCWTIWLCTAWNRRQACWLCFCINIYDLLQFVQWFW